MAAVNVRLRQLIDALGIKYVRAAEDMGITKNHLGNWMREEKPVYPDIYKIYRFCRIRGVDFNWVFLGDPSGLPERVSRILLGLEPKQADPEERAIQAGGTQSHAKSQS